MALEHILIAVDGSPASDEATRVGLEIATAAGGEIFGIASAVDAGLVVVGSRGRGPLASVVLGRVSQGLLDAATIPVAVVHSPQAG